MRWQGKKTFFEKKFLFTMPKSELAFQILPFEAKILILSISKLKVNKTTRA